MKKVSSGTLIILALAFSVQAVSGQEEIKVPKIGVIDLQEIAATSGVGKSAQDKLRDWFESKKRDLDAKERSLQQETSNLENQRTVLSEDAYSRKKNEIEQRVLAFRQEQEAAQRELERKQQEALDEFAQVVGPVIEQTGKELGFTVILDRRSGVYYFDRSIDITKVIISKLNNGQSSGETAPQQ